MAMSRIYTDLTTAFICGALALVSIDAIAYLDVVHPVYYVALLMSIIIMVLIAFSNYVQLTELATTHGDQS
jgi:hypothetical protein